MGSPLTLPLQTYEEKLSRLDGLLFQLKREVGSFRQLREQAEALRVERDVCRRELQRAQEAASKRAREAKALENENKDLRKRVEIAQWRVGKLREEGREARRRQRAQPSLPAPPSTRSPAHRRSGAQDAAPVLGVDGASQFLDAAVRVLEAPLPKAADGDAHSPAAFAGGGPSALAARMRARTDDALPYLLPAICEVLPHAPYRATDETQRLLRFIWAAVYFTPRSSHDSSPAVGVGVGSSVPPGARAAFRLHRIIETLSAPVAGGPGAGEAQRSRGAPHSAERGPVAVPGSQPAHESHASPAPSVAISVARDGAGGGYSPFLAHSDPLVRTLSALLVARFARHTDAVTSALRVIRREVGTEQVRGCTVTAGSGLRWGSARPSTHTLTQCDPFLPLVPGSVLLCHLLGPTRPHPPPRVPPLHRHAAGHRRAPRHGLTRLYALPVTRVGTVPPSPPLSDASLSHPDSA